MEAILPDSHVIIIHIYRSISMCVLAISTVSVYVYMCYHLILWWKSIISKKSKPTYFSQNKF